MAKKQVATQRLYVGTALAYMPGDVIEDDTAVERNGWQDGVASEGTKAAETAVKEAPAVAEKPATGISDQVHKKP